MLYFKESVLFQSKYCKLKKVLLNKKLHLSEKYYVK